MSPKFQNFNLFHSVDSETVCCDRKNGRRESDSIRVPFFILEHGILIMSSYT